MFVTLLYPGTNSLSAGVQVFNLPYMFSFPKTAATKTLGFHLIFHCIHPNACSNQSQMDWHTNLNPNLTTTKFLPFQPQYFSQNPLYKKPFQAREEVTPMAVSSTTTDFSVRLELQTGTDAVDNPIFDTPLGNRRLPANK